jgi:hypothetical protein
MGLDLRLPIGLLFFVYGALLTVYGLARPQPVLGINVNLIWGVVMAAFGAVMLQLARQAGKRPPPARGA